MQPVNSSKLRDSTYVCFTWLSWYKHAHYSMHAPYTTVCNFNMISFLLQPYVNTFGSSNTATTHGQAIPYVIAAVPPLCSLYFCCTMVSTMAHITCHYEYEHLHLYGSTPPRLAHSAHTGIYVHVKVAWQGRTPSNTLQTQNQGIYLQLRALSYTPTQRLMLLCHLYTYA